MSKERDDNKQSAMNKSVLHLTAGGIGATAGACVTCPLEVVQTRLQSTILNLKGLQLTPAANVPSNIIVNTHGRNYFYVLFQYMRHMVKSEGVLSLFKGLSPSLMGIAPAKSVYFYVYSECKLKANRSGYLKPDSHAVHTCSAVSAGLVTSTVTNPVWFLKTRLQLDTSRQTKASTSSRLLNCIRTAYQNHGLSAFFRGLSASYVGVLETVIYFIFYEEIKKTMRQNRGQAGQSGGFHVTDFLSAAVISKLAATLVMYPHEVVRTRLRQDVVDKTGRLKYRHFFQSLLCVALEEGRAGLYGGFATNLMRQIPNTAVTFLTYEAIIHFVADG